MPRANPAPPISFFHAADIVLVLLAIFVSYGSPAIAQYYELSIWWQFAIGIGSVIIFALIHQVFSCHLLFQIMVTAMVISFRLLPDWVRPMYMRFMPAAIFCTNGIITLSLLFLEWYVSVDFAEDVPTLCLLFAFHMGNGVVMLIMELVSYYGNAKLELISGILMLCVGAVCFSVYIHLLISWRRQGKRVQPTEEVPRVPTNGDGNI